MVLAFKLKKGGIVKHALEKIADGARKYRGFILNKKEPEHLSIGNRELDCDVYTVNSLYASEAGVHDDVVILLVDIDKMLEADGDKDSEFWIAFQNLVAMVVAEIDPYYGLISDDEALRDILKEGIDKIPVRMDYFSYDFIEDKLKGREAVIRKYATRRLRYGLLLVDMILPEQRRKDYLREMGF
jgi:hypothetical protein